MVKRSDIPKIIKKHGFNLNYILNDKNFPLKEKDLPDLCADRINYSLLTATVLGKSKSVQRIISNLSVHQNRWVFKDFVVAKEFAELFREINNKFYSGLPSATMFRTLADYLRYAITKKYISEKDMYETDSYVLAKIKPYLKSDSRLRLLFRRLSRKTTIKNNPDNYDVEVYCKSRIINPLCWHNKKIMKISEIDKDWGKVLKQESIPKHYYLKFVD